MSWNNKVIWTEGMFLQPSHFQQLDRNFQNWIEARCGDLIPFSWGITELEIDQKLLSLGKFAIKHCRGIFPDGTPFNIPDEHPLPTPLDISTENKDQLIYLALPVKRHAGKEISWEPGQWDETSRYAISEMEVIDVHTQSQQNSIVIQSGELWTRLCLSGGNLDAFVTIPVARLIEMKADKQVVLDRHFIPACLHCNASSVLMDYIQEIAGVMHQRGEALAQRLGTAGAGGVAEIVDFLLLQIINRYEPLFIHWQEVKRFHPEQLFRYLIQIVGELSTITRPEHRFDAFPAYRHDDLQNTFDPIIIALREALSWVSESRAIPLPLEEHPHQIRTSLIKDKELLSSADFVLAVGADLPSATIRAQLPKQTTIATVEKLRDFVMSQVPGIKLNPLAVAPKQIPYHKGMVYFELEKHHELWEDLMESGTLAIHFSGEYPGLVLEFWAIRS